MITITLKGREIPLNYTVYEMKLIQEEIAPMSKAMDLVLGRNPEDEEDMTQFGGAAHVSAAATLIRILGNAGLEEAGETPDLTDRWVMKAMRPAQLADAVNACMSAMREGMKSEIPPKKKKSGPVDVVLEEFEKKKGTAS